MGTSAIDRSIASAETRLAAAPEERKLYFRHKVALFTWALAFEHYKRFVKMRSPGMPRAENFDVSFAFFHQAAELWEAMIADIDAGEQSDARRIHLDGALFGAALARAQADDFRELPERLTRVIDHAPGRQHRQAAHFLLALHYDRLNELEIAQTHYRAATDEAHWADTRRVSVNNATKETEEIYRPSQRRAIAERAGQLLAELSRE